MVKILHFYTHSGTDVIYVTYYACRCLSMIRHTRACFARLLYCPDLVSNDSYLRSLQLFSCFGGDFEIAVNVTAMWARLLSLDSGNSFLLNLHSNIRTPHSCAPASNRTEEYCILASTRWRTNLGPGEWVSLHERRKGRTFWELLKTHFYTTKSWINRIDFASKRTTESLRDIK